MRIFNRSKSIYLFHSIALVLLIAGNLQFTVAQSQAFTPSAENDTFLSGIFSKHEKLYRNELLSLPAGNRKDFEKAYQERWTSIKEKFDNREIYTAADATQYLNSLVQEIVRSNPALQNSVFDVYFSLSDVPNASYIGEGIILFNLGLFQKLDNESQVVFVLCHEISHFYFQHSENSIRKYVTDINSPGVQSELRKINKNEFKKGEQLEKLVKGLVFNDRRHSRDHEKEADSMGIELMRNTRFDISEALTALGMLDSIDNETFDTNDCLQKIFDFKEYPFKKNWIHKEDGLLGGHARVETDNVLADSLKTHPDCLLRIEMLKPLIDRYRSVSAIKNVVDKAKFDELRRRAAYEIIEHSYLLNDYATSLYNTLKLLRASPSDAYLITQVGRIFNGFYNAQKMHTLGKVARLPSPYYPPAYNDLLQFIQNLYLQDFAQISNNFLKQYEQPLQYYIPFTNEYNISLRITKP